MPRRLLRVLVWFYRRGSDSDRAASSVTVATSWAPAILGKQDRGQLLRSQMPY